jgi:abnormal spindle-like microcephaly-associated protein
VLSDSKTLEKFTKGRCNVPSGMFETKYKTQMRALVLSRIMILVFFLDQAKDADMLDNVPRLFTISSDVKSSREVLLAICRACLSSEGDIIKHFSRIGLRVSYTQHPVDEVEFKVTNLAADFRDGVLLTRLAEIVTESPFKSLLTALRLPAVSRLQKKFNVSFAISKIKDYGIVVDDNVNSHHIIDGHRDKVLTLLWCIIAHCCMTKLLKGEHVENEIRAVIRSAKARSPLLGIQRPNRIITESQFHAMSSSNGTPEDILKSLLLRWTQAVCSSYGLIVQDFTHSFANGRIFCCLIHYYHPTSIQLDEMLLAQQSPNGASSDPALLGSHLMDNQSSFWSKANKFIRELGGIPGMTSTSNTMNPPDEKSILLCLSYLCSRLMESSTEIFATILIQASYRRHRSRILMKRKMVAASFLFRCWSLHKGNYYHAQKRRFQAAVAILERFVLSNKSGLVRLRCARLERELRTEATIRMQVRFVFAVEHFETQYDL